MRPLFDVISYTSFYAVQHNPSGDQHPLGDGVDSVFDEEGNALVPGTPGFIPAWADALNSDPQETLEAYSPQHVERR